MRLLGLLFFSAIVLFNPSCQSVSESHTIWIGTYTGKGSEGIYSASFNPESGALADLKLEYKVNSPSYLALNDNNLWAVSEQDGASVLSFTKDNEGLGLLGVKPANGSGACYVDVAESKIAVANYGTGNGIVYQLDSSGEIKGELFSYQHSGNGPNQNRQESPHAHCAIFSSDGSVLYVVDLGTDQIMGYPTEGQGVGQPFVAYQLEPGDGPRHLTFHPNQSWAYVINELSNSIVALAIEGDGSMTQIDRKSTLPSSFTSHNQCADIHVSGDGKFLYGSNRGHNSLVTFAIKENGVLDLLDHTNVEGEWPRNFTLSLDNNYLLVANQRTDNIAVFSRDSETGLLTYSGNQLELSLPVCLKFE